MEGGAGVNQPARIFHGRKRRGWSWALELRVRCLMFAMVQPRQAGSKGEGQGGGRALLATDTLVTPRGEGGCKSGRARVGGSGDSGTGRDSVWG